MAHSLIFSNIAADAEITCLICVAKPIKYSKTYINLEPSEFGNHKRIMKIKLTASNKTLSKKQSTIHSKLYNVNKTIERREVQLHCYQLKQATRPFKYHSILLAIKIAERLNIHGVS